MLLKAHYILNKISSPIFLFFFFFGQFCYGEPNNILKACPQRLAIFKTNETLKTNYCYIKTFYGSEKTEKVKKKSK